MELPVSTVLLTQTKNIKTPYFINANGEAGYPDYKDYFCLYENNKKTMYHDSLKNGIVISSRCIMNHDFFFKRNFKPDSKMAFIADFQEFTRTIYTYKNKNLQ